MSALIALVWMGFQGLAICTLAGMSEMGFSAAEALGAAVFVVAIGGLVTRAMSHKTATLRTAREAPAYKVSGELQTSFS